MVYNVYELIFSVYFIVLEEVELRMVVMELSFENRISNLIKEVNDNV